jgi:hypothetical protein
MARTKSKSRPAQQEPQAASGAPPQTLDDRTPLDDLAGAKRKREAVPTGFRKRLPAGPERVVSVDREELGQPGGLPLRVTDVATGQAIMTDKLKIEGDSQAVVASACGAPVGIGIGTSAAILVGRSRPVKSQ